jgi:hypothetical protein
VIGMLPKLHSATNSFRRQCQYSVAQDKECIRNNPCATKRSQGRATECQARVGLQLIFAPLRASATAAARRLREVVGIDLTEGRID